MRGGDYVMKILHMASFLLTVIGALNWGVVGLFNLNVVNMLFGSVPSLENLIYILVGVSAVYLVATHKGDCKICSKK